MNWFQHDTAATQDAKIKKLIIRHGAEGYAVYFHCLELIASDISETNLTFELEHDSEIIADNLKIKGNSEQSGRERTESIMRTLVELGLFSESDGRIFCFKLIKRINLSQTSNVVFRTAISKRKAEIMINHDSVMTDHDKIMTHHGVVMNTNQPTIPTNNTNNTEDDENTKTKRFSKPTIPEISAYCFERHNTIDAEKFYDHYESVGWKIGNKPMKNWQAAVRTWERNDFNNGKPKVNERTAFLDMEE